MKRARPLRPRRPPLLESAAEALTAGNWRLARQLFEKSLQEEETAEALEGLGMAAWWLDDEKTIFSARERAYRAYLRKGDRRGAGRVAVTLGEDSFYFRGQTAVARGWYRRANRLLAGAGRIAELGWLRLWEGDFELMTSADMKRVRRATQEAGSIAAGLGLVDLEMAALALEGLAYVVEGRSEEGLARLDESTTAATSGEMTDPIAIGISCCYLVTACERMRDFPRAAEWCQRMKSFCERTGFNALLAVCRAQYAGVLTWQGEWRAAERELTPAIEGFRETRPAMEADGVIRLAELRRRQGALDEAAKLVRAAEAHPLARLVEAAIALDRGDAGEAASLARRFLRQVPPRNRTDRFSALEILLRAELARGRDAREVLREIREIAEGVGTAPLRAAALAAEALAAENQGRAGNARRLLEDALDAFTRCGAPYEAARVRLDLARVLSSEGRTERAREELSEAQAALRKLGVRAEPAPAALPAGRAESAGGLTRREREVLRLLAEGLGNREIAKRLGVSAFTIKRHVANILGKLGLPTRAAAAAWAVRAGL